MFRLIRLVILSAISLSLAGWVILKYTKNQPVVIEQGSQQTDTEVAIGGPFELVDVQGKTRSDQEFRGKYLLVYFGYTFCPDICPMALTHISEALKLLKKDRDQVVPLFITVDPQRDSLDALKTYATHFDPNFVMLTGNPEQINKAMKGYRAYGAKVHDAKATDYLMDHTSLIYLMDRSGRFVRFFPHTTPPQEIADGIIKVLATEKQKKM